MLSELFYWLFNMSIAASIAGTIVCLIGKIRKIPRSMICTLWVIPFLRMWVPIGINSPYSLMSLISKFTTRSVPVYEGVVDVSMTNCVMAADSYFPVTYRIDPLETVFQIASVVWVVVTAALLLIVTAVYIVTKAELKGARHLCDAVYLSDTVASPAVYGIVRAKILLPHTYEAGDLKFILLHEETHIKRNDNLRRLLATVTACIHWFNPLSWLFLNHFLAQVELVCDEAVLKRCGEAEKEMYATALLHCAERKSLCASPFGGAKVRTRIECILSYKKLSLFATIVLAILAAFAGYALLTNAM